MDRRFGNCSDNQCNRPHLIGHPPVDSGSLSTNTWTGRNEICDNNRIGHLLPARAEHRPFSLGVPVLEAYDMWAAEHGAPRADAPEFTHPVRMHQ